MAVPLGDRDAVARADWLWSVFEHSQDAILLTAPSGEILAANRAACRLFGRSEAELCEVGRGGVVDVEDPRLPGLFETRRRDGAARGELTFLRADGSRFPGEVHSTIFADRDGEARTRG